MLQYLQHRGNISDQSSATQIKRGTNKSDQKRTSCLHSMEWNIWHTRRVKRTLRLHFVARLCSEDELGVAFFLVVLTCFHHPVSLNYFPAWIVAAFSNTLPLSVTLSLPLSRFCFCFISNLSLSLSLAVCHSISIFCAFLKFSHLFFSTGVNMLYHVNDRHNETTSMPGRQFRLLSRCGSRLARPNLCISPMRSEAALAPKAPALALVTCPASTVCLPASQADTRNSSCELHCESWFLYKFLKFCFRTTLKVGQTKQIRG